MARKGLFARGDTLPLIRRLWRDWMRPHARTLALVLLLVLLVAGATGLYPVLIKAAFDAFTAKDETAILLAPLFVIGVTSVKGFSLLALTVLTNKVVTRIEADMQTALYGHLIDADLAQIGRESPAALTQRFTTDFLFIKEALTRLSTVFLREVATIVALIGAMLWIDPVLTLVAGVTVPFIAQPIGKIGKKLRRVAISTQEQTGQMASLITESLAGTRIAKTYGLEGYLKAKAATTFDDVRKLKMKAANARGRLDPLLEAGGGFAVAAVLVLIGQRIVSGGSTVGDFTGFVSALILAAQPIRALGNLNAIVQEAASALQRTFAVMDETPRIQDKPGAKALAVGRRRGSLLGGGIFLQRRPDRSPSCGFHRRGGAHDRAGRPLGLRQIDAPVARPPSLRRNGRRGSDRRAGCARRDAEIPALRHRRGEPGRGSVRRHGAGQHRLRPGRRHATRRSSRPARPRRRTTSSCGCRRAMTRWWARRAGGCRAASASGSPWHGPSSRTRRSCCSTRRPARSIRNPSGSCRTPSAA